MERPKRSDIEWENSIRATRERIEASESKQWATVTDAEREAIHIDREEGGWYGPSWMAEARLQSAERYEKQLERFYDVLYDLDTGRVSPTGYLALKELQRAFPDEDSDLNAEEDIHTEIVDALEKLIDRLSEGQEESVASSEPLGYFPDGFLFNQVDLPYLEAKAIWHYLKATEGRQRVAALSSVLFRYERFGDLAQQNSPPSKFRLWAGEPPDVYPEYFFDYANAPVDSESKESGKEYAQPFSELPRIAREYVVEAARLLRERPTMSHFVTLEEAFGKKFPHVQGDAPVKTLKRVTGYLEDGRGFGDFRKRVIDLEGHLAKDKT